MYPTAWPNVFVFVFPPSHTRRTTGRIVASGGGLHAARGVLRVSHRYGDYHVRAVLGPAIGLSSGYGRGGTRALHVPLGRIVGISGDSGS